MLERKGSTYKVTRTVQSEVKTWERVGEHGNMMTLTYDPSEDLGSKTFSVQCKGTK